MRAAVDFGLSNIDLLLCRDDCGLSNLVHAQLPSRLAVNVDVLRAALAALDVELSECEQVAVTGGQHRLLPERIEGTPIVKVDEITAIGRGGLRLAQSINPDVCEVLVVSAGSGTAVVSARGERFEHVTGSAVGGGTLLGLCRLLIGSADPREIDALALAGDSNKVDLTIAEAIGGAVGRIPADANAVNFGRVPSLERLSFAREDLAAGVVVLVGQVIAALAINAARAERLDRIVLVGHTMDMVSVRRVVHTVAGYYGATMLIPDTPGIATALGALLTAQRA
ncbi:MAG: Fumble domain-containing protein [Anaerolineae bacterium]|nr:Fumble domain-containing protein [Anaerolineae bacterium]